MQQLFHLARLVAPRETAVLITGESGTGKELVARGIHQLSRRGQQPCVVVNCAALPESLLEAELFGHARGAFTGAVQAQLGRIHAAHRGTLFLDEIGELPLAVQAKLLRFVQEGEVQRLGSPDVFRVDVRLLAATNADLERRVEEGRFRADLFYRLSVFPLELPPLRQRPEDVVELAQDLLDGLARRTGAGGKALSPQAAQCLAEYPWPGNVRQLQHALERAMILADGGRDIQPEHLPAALHRFAAAEAASAAVRRPPRSAGSEIANRTWGGIGSQAAWA
jgi:transcriptional regulator with GAF, ATPase, and Fis domain